VSYVARLGGEVRVPLDELVSFAPDIGFAVEDGKMVIAVDMDDAPVRTDGLPEPGSDEAFAIMAAAADNP
jgi:hypothetical protein